jgi:hypothetical protein
VKSLLIAALAAAAPAQPAPRPCVTQAQIENLTLFALPPLLDALATKCGPSLPSGAYLLNGGRVLARDLEAGSDGRWAEASSAMAVVGGDKMPKGLSGRTARSMLHDVAVAELFAKIKPEECAQFDRIAGLLSPLPPANLAGLVAAAAAMGMKGDKKGPAICPAPLP